MEANSLVIKSVPYSIIVPVRNEAKILPDTVPKLLAAAHRNAQIIYVCNGCTDKSAGIIRELGGSRITVIEIAESGKCTAFNVGEKYVDSFPRFYIDADISVGPEIFKSLVEVLSDGKADLVSPRLVYDLSHVSLVSREISKVWLMLPHAKHATYQCVIGITACGRTRWPEFPNILGDDIFMVANTPKKMRQIDYRQTVMTNAPPTFFDWIKARKRWRTGEQQLSELRLSVPKSSNQFRELFRALIFPPTTIGASLYIGARVIGTVAALVFSRQAHAWQPSRINKTIP